MVFKAIDSVPGRIKKGHEYAGGFVMVDVIVSKKPSDFRRENQLRIVVHDEKRQWMTFNPKIFVPVN